MNSDGKFSIGNFDLIDLFNLIYLNNFLLAFYPQFLYEDSNFPQNIIMKNNSSNLSLDLNNNNKEKILSANQKGIKSEIDLSASFNNQKMQKTTYHQSLKTNIKETNEENKRYRFNTVTSRKKEKKYVRLKINNIITRVHNKDCLLKKIKAKYLKFLYSTIQENSKGLKFKYRKFNQIREVRNLNIIHNRDHFIDLTVSDFLINNNIISSKELETIMNSNRSNLIELLQIKIKYHYQFCFLKSSFFKDWIKDPVLIYRSWRGEGMYKSSVENKNCIKYPKHSKNLFKTNTDNYEKYKKLLLIFSCNFIFHFQNNSLKFGKKCKNF